MPKQLVSSSSNHLINFLSTSTSLDEPRIKRVRIEKDNGDDFLVYLAEGEPSSYAEAISSSDAPFWKAIDCEMKSLLENNS